MEENKKFSNVIVLMIFAWMLFSIIVMIALGIKDRRYKYLNQFEKLIQTSYPSDTTSKAEYQKQYDIWLNNKGYSDIYIEDDKLVLAEDDVSLYDVIGKGENISGTVSVNGIYYRKYGSGLYDNMTVQIDLDKDNNMVGSISLLSEGPDGRHRICASKLQYNVSLDVYEVQDIDIAIRYKDGVLYVSDSTDEVDSDYASFTGDYQLIYPYNYGEE